MKKLKVIGINIVGILLGILPLTILSKILLGMIEVKKSEKAWSLLTISALNDGLAELSPNTSEVFSPFNIPGFIVLTAMRPTVTAIRLVKK